MTYRELKLSFYFAYADRHGTFSGLPASLYFAVVDLANEAGCENPVDPFYVAEALRQRDFPDADIAAVLSAVSHMHPAPVPA